MKKLIMMAAIACLGLAAQAKLSVDWYASGVLNDVGIEYASGNATLYLTFTYDDDEVSKELTGYMSSGVICAEGINARTSVEDYEYSAYYKIIGPEFLDEQGVGYHYEYTSGTLTGTVIGESLSLDFGSSGSWEKYGGGVPEPTSGVLLLVGLAGLALKRKRA